jgi:hypothetical protein
MTIMNLVSSSLDMHMSQPLTVAWAHQKFEWLSINDKVIEMVGGGPPAVTQVVLAVPVGDTYQS